MKTIAFVPGIKQQGFYILAISIILLLGIVTLSLLLMRNVITAQRISMNDYHMTQAFEAAEAGLEYGLAYLEKNRAAILLDTNNDGILDTYTHSAITNVALPNNATFTVSYNNVTTGNLNLIEITSLGANADGKVTRRLTQRVEAQALTLNMKQANLIVRLKADVRGNAYINNPEKPSTIISGQETTMGGNAKTAVPGLDPSSTSQQRQTDISDFNSAISPLSGDAFFNYIFGMSKPEMRALATLTYSSNTTTNYTALLNGSKNAIIWIDQMSGSATFNNTAVIGTPTEPVLLIINGDMNISGGITVYGVVYAVKSLQNDIAGNPSIYGGLAAEGNISIRGSPQIIYDSAILTRLNQMGAFGKVPGSWQDF